MSLTQQQIDAMSGATGLKYNSLSNNIPSLADKIRALKPVENTAPLYVAGKRAVETFKELGSDVSTAFSETPQRALEGATNADGTISPLKGLISAPASAGVTLGKTGVAVAKGAGALLAIPFDAYLTRITQENPELVDKIKSSQGYKDIANIKLTPEAQAAFSKVSDLASKFPDVADSVTGFIETILLGGAGQAEKQIANKGKKAFNIIENAIPETPVVEQSIKNFSKTIDESVEITRPKLSDLEKQAALKEGRVTTEGVLKTRKVKPNVREQRVAESVEPLVRDGRVSVKNKPEVNIENISQEVSRTNSDVKNFIADRKIPLRKDLLKQKLSAVKKDAEIVFTTDPTLERTYDALIEEFMKNVEKGDTFGVFEARQSFDKIPAVKKLLDGMKGATGENLRRQAVLDIRKAANDYVAEMLDVPIEAKALRRLQPKEATIFTEKAKNFKDVEQFVQNQKKTLQEKVMKDTSYRAEKRRIDKVMKKEGLTFDEAIKREGIDIDFENDLRDLWQNVNTKVDASAGKLYASSLKRESQLLEAIDNIAASNSGTIDTNVIQRLFKDYPWLKTAVGVGVGAGGVQFLGN